MCAEVAAAAIRRAGHPGLRQSLAFEGQPIDTDATAARLCGEVQFGRRIDADVNASARRLEHDVGRGWTDVVDSDAAPARVAAQGAERAADVDAAARGLEGH